MKIALAVVFAVVSYLSLPSLAQADGWNNTKNVADDIIHSGWARTFYCGCPYLSDSDSDGSGRVFVEQCSYVPQKREEKRAGRVEWEHVVPASLMPVRQRQCWGLEGDRQRCEKEDPVSQSMMFDLHNLVPSVGQVNGIRSNLRYGEVGEKGTVLEGCGVKYDDQVFEPLDCRKGDVARIWLYMADRHGLYISGSELRMFKRWSELDPISPIEYKREQRVAKYTFVINPYVHYGPVNVSGLCPWE